MDASAMYLFSTMLSPGQNIDLHFLPTTAWLLPEVLPAPLPHSVGLSPHHNHPFPRKGDAQWDQL